MKQLLCVGMAFMLALGASAFTLRLEDGLLAHLPLTNDWRDYSSNHLSVNVTGRVAIVEGAAYFPGNEAWLELPYLPLNDRPFAVTMWLKVTGNNPMYGLLEQRGAREYNQWLHLMLRGAWQPFLGQLLTDAVSPVSIPLRQWVHLVFQHDGERQQIWINGAPVVARKCPPYQGTEGATCLGKSPRWSNVPSKDFEGFLRNARIYGRALQREEIEALSGTSQRPLVKGAFEVEVTTAVKAAHIGIPFLSIDGNKLTIIGENRQIYEVEATEQLGRDWRPLVILTNRGMPLEFLDPTMPASGRQFYRIKVRDAAPPPDG